jgi:hypothetical protein
VREAEAGQDFSDAIVEMVAAERSETSP